MLSVYGSGPGQRTRQLNRSSPSSLDFMMQCSPETVHMSWMLSHGQQGQILVKTQYEDTSSRIPPASPHLKPREGIGDVMSVKEENYYIAEWIGA